MCTSEVDYYFSLQWTVLQKNKFLANPRKICNIEECCLQMNKKPGKVIEKKGSRNIHHVTSQENGETITAVTCCNTDSNFLPQYCIFKDCQAYHSSDVVVLDLATETDVLIFTSKLHHPEFAVDSSRMTVDLHTTVNISATSPKLIHTQQAKS
ncbi:HTH CENPB-type domain-containing protein [Trichonephila clavipes]|uniref:HTH CENPB-type domain-containing protein n=1 Tax=Trichonephila clavipes TaxID=2585209 RepID=A0A8X6UTU5_TRICX|nr:HTH CENPB-type domain-containing protein [Trichonephila clavipes]